MLEPDVEVNPCGSVTGGISKLPFVTTCADPCVVTTHASRVIHKNNAGQARGGRQVQARPLTGTAGHRPKFFVVLFGSSMTFSKHVRLAVFTSQADTKPITPANSPPAAFPLSRFSPFAFRFFVSRFVAFPLFAFAIRHSPSAIAISGPRDLDACAAFLPRNAVSDGALKTTSRFW